MGGNDDEGHGRSDSLEAEDTLGTKRAEETRKHVIRTLEKFLVKVSSLG